MKSQTADLGIHSAALSPLMPLACVCWWGACPGKMSHSPLLTVCPVVVHCQLAVSAHRRSADQRFTGHHTSITASNTAAHKSHKPVTLQSAAVSLALCKRRCKPSLAPQLVTPHPGTALPDKVSRGWVVTAVNNDVVLPHNVQGIEGVEALGVHLHLDAGVEGLARSLSR